MVGRQRIDQVLETYLLALAGRDQCPDSASPLVKHGLAQNLEAAEEAYAYAVADGLEREAAALDGAVAELAAANARARRDLQGAQPMAALLAALEAATRRARGVLAAAGLHS